MISSLTQCEVLVNGEARQVPAGTDLPALLAEMNVVAEKAKGVAVAVNDEVVPRAKWAGHLLEDGDRVEIVTATQGG